jgi:hypothetical protein
MEVSLERLKLRRIRLRNEIAFRGKPDTRTQQAEDIEALHEELQQLSQQIQDAER